MEYFKANGGYFTFSTVRYPGGGLSAVSEAKKLVNLPVVVNNGASLYDYQADQDAERYGVPYELVKAGL